MATSLRWNAWKLMDDVKKTRGDLAKLEKHCRKKAVELKQKDLSDLVDEIKEVEVDVSLMLVDSVFADFHSGEENGVIAIEIPRVFVHLDALFGDIKRARSEYKEGLVSPQTMDRLNIDCRRFIKALWTIEKELGGPQGKEEAHERTAVKSTRKMGSCADPKGIELIWCKRQPGNLLISKHACGKRYLLSLRDGKHIPNDVFGMVRKSGLDICKNCPEGRIVFKNSEKRTVPFSRNFEPAVRMGPGKVTLLKPE